eukprot:INCI14365.1.p2 GENE.INCI14365.1~~INCI14365.1.p2  ORF type:complete len:107 (-),score=11.78 INCI14365.1:46-366(-)
MNRRTAANFGSVSLNVVCTGQATCFVAVDETRQCFVQSCTAFFLSTMPRAEHANLALSNDCFLRPCSPAVMLSCIHAFTHSFVHGFLPTFLPSFMHTLAMTYMHPI